MKNVLGKLKSVDLIDNFQKEIVIVNDCSVDNTEEVAKKFIEENPELEVAYFRHEYNQGKGAALNTGIRRATGDYIIVQDTDLEYDRQEFNILLKPVFEGYADVMYGLPLHGQKTTPHPFFLAYDREQVPGIPEQHVYQPQPDGYGNMPQTLTRRHSQRPQTGRKPLRFRARGNSQDFQSTQSPNLRSGRILLLLRPCHSFVSVVVDRMVARKAFRLQKDYYTQLIFAAEAIWYIYYLYNGPYLYNLLKWQL